MTDIEKAREMPSEKSMEKARVIARSPKGFDFGWGYNPDGLTLLVATALDSAIAETREECAARADDLLMTSFDDYGEGFNAGLRALAKAIRATGKESER